jgi:sulfite reductase (NADPH) flavoprotein alpha-component
MAKDVDAMLHKIVQEQGKMDEAAVKAYVKQLKTEKRYLRDVY